ncbi:sigma-70 family RNA polymerase sigma factor [Pseudobutyrivibrio sp. LB2011]|uniref:sigma-70 family RNA polymerase sigma factor n=1 Tax=Pseudobutyrivibrio sp. LB2011 TaxID=1408312 RepID=UPI0005D1D73D|nr:sigma-70 family RNA polymerase sigma factor [Pseudobutyrivibrio sp. LB2011]
MADRDIIASVEHSLVQRYNERGYLLEDEVIDCCVDHDLDLAEIDVVCDRLLKRNVIFREYDPNRVEDDSDTDDIYDRSQLDYDEIFESIKREYPSCENLVDQVKAILPPQHKEWRTLIGEAQAGNSFARDRLILMYLRTLLKNAFDFSNTYYCDFEDCFQNAVIGLINAIGKYDVTSPDSFVSYFPLWARQVMNRDCIVKGTLFRFPVHYKEQFLATVNGLNETEIGFDAVANMDQLIIENQSKEDFLDDIYNALDDAFSMFFQAEYEQMANGKYNYNHILPYLPVFDVFVGEEDITDKIIADEKASSIRDILDSCLNERERDVVMMRYGLDDDEPKTLEAVGNAFGVTRERIRQIESRAMRKLRLKYRVPVT